MNTLDMVRVLIGPDEGKKLVLMFGTRELEPVQVTRGDDTVIVVFDEKRDLSDPEKHEG